MNFYLEMNNVVNIDIHLDDIEKDVESDTEHEIVDIIT